MGGLSEPVGLVLVALVTVVGSYLTAKASNRAALQSSRIQAEEGAFERAKSFYVGVIEGQDSEIEDLKTQVEELKADAGRMRTQAAHQERQLAQCRNTCRSLARRVGAPEPDFED